MPKPLRCAIYTRKSSEEGLEQGFNSLHAQREACEAYVLSQAGEGWSALKATYDDGGFSGGSMDRPGLRRLLADVEAGRVDVVVVYKVDRLTRALADFAKIVEAFDGQGVSFVSVTQAFNTTTSMGRLTLNVLLSFAQFEREVTGERIRDKIAASKAKGMWMGGRLPLGYDRPTNPLTRALVVNEAEACTVRLMFSRYLELGSVHALRDWLELEGVRSKAYVSGKGISRGGVPFSRGALFHLLKNRVYLGEIVHGERRYPDAHPPIVDPETFERVQAKLSEQAVRHDSRPTRVSTMALKGLIFDADGEPMSPAFTRGREGRVYRYYVSAPLQQGGRRSPSDDTIRRVSSHVVEDVVRGVVDKLAGAPDRSVSEHVARVEVHPSTVQLLLRRAAFFKRAGDPQAELDTLARRLGPGERLSFEPGRPELVRLTLLRRLRFQGGRVWLVDEGGRPASTTTRADPVLINGLKRAHELVAEGAAAPLGRVDALRFDKAPSSPYERNLVRSAFLAPDIQALILEGRHPPDLNLSRLVLGEIPPCWDEQRRAFGIVR